MIFDWFSGLFSNDLAVDLGTSNTLIYMRSKGIVSDEPSVVAAYVGNRGQREIVAVGKSAKAMIGRTPEHVDTIRPIQNGVIADFDYAEEMLRYFIQAAHHGRAVAKPRIVVCVPNGITEVEKRAVEESAHSAGAREVHLIEAPMAAAIGADLPIQDAAGNMVVALGGGTTEVAVISLSGIVYSRSIRVGGDKLDESVMQHVKRRHNLLIGEGTAERIKIEIGCALPFETPRTMEVKGRDMIAGVPRTVEITSEEIQEAIRESVVLIVDTIKMALERTPPELAADIVDRGIVLTGGGAMLGNFAKLLRQETRLPVIVPDAPQQCAALGTGKVLDQLELLRAIAIA